MTACEKDGHAWAPEWATADHRLTEICVRADCEATLTRDMTEKEAADFDAEIRAEDEEYREGIEN